MFFRRRRMALQRLAALAVALLPYLVSVAPAAASVVYCISDDGHQGFEIVASTDHGCASCCHDEPAGTAHDGFEPETAGCKDIALSSDQAIRPAASVDRDAASTALALPVASIARGATIAGEILPTRSTASRNTAASLRRHTVLLI